MTAFTENLNFFASLATVVGQLFILYIALLWLYSRAAKGSAGANEAEKILARLGSKATVAGFVIVFGAVCLSLVYSEIIGYAACELCWVQRIFLFPQAVIFGLALWKKTRDAALYGLTLSLLGICVSAYHFYGQSINPSVLPACNATGAVSCAVRYFVEFGYITLPMMAFTAFLLLIVFALLSRYAEKHSA